MDAGRFDTELFLALNDEYAGRPIAKPPTNRLSREERAQRRVMRIERLLGQPPQRLLDLGCGRGELGHDLARRGYDVVAVDVEPYGEWKTREHPNLTFLVADLAREEPLPAGRIDAIYSYSVMEHVREPFELLRACRRLLAPDGLFLLVAHLYRSATGSHRAREVFFPWPHLLFTDDVFEEAYRRVGKSPQRPAWLNKLTYADYFWYFDLLGYRVEKEFIRKRELDRSFYERFEDELSRYSEFDLTTNAVDVLLSVDSTKPPAESPRSYREIEIGRSGGASADGHIDEESQPRRVDDWAYWGSDGCLSRAWQCQRHGALRRIEGLPCWLRVSRQDGDAPHGSKFYLSSRGPSFDVPPEDRSVWRVPADTVCRLGVAIELEHGDMNVELWVIEYDDESRLGHLRRRLRSGTAHVVWKTSPRVRTLRIAYRFQGGGSIVLGPVAFSRDG